MFLNMRYMPAMHHAEERLATTRSVNAFMQAADLFVVWSAVMRLSSVGSLPLAKNALHSPTSSTVWPIETRDDEISDFARISDFSCGETKVRSDA